MVDLATKQAISVHAIVRLASVARDVNSEIAAFRKNIDL
jgi:hypothetical protein